MPKALFSRCGLGQAGRSSLSCHAGKDRSQLIKPNFDYYFPVERVSMTDAFDRLIAKYVEGESAYQNYIA
jgi:hypothetical protein